MGVLVEIVQGQVQCKHITRTAYVKDDNKKICLKTIRKIKKNDDDKNIGI